MADDDEVRMLLSEARRITEELIEKHGLTGWRLHLDTARRRAGQTRYTNKVISLSLPLLHERPHADTLNTITHEIAHAMVGHAHGHDEVWQAQHKALGGNGERCWARRPRKAVDPT